MSDTTEMEKLRILTMHECGKSTTEIAKAVNKSARTVQRWLAHQKKQGNMDRKPRGLRPRKTTAEQDANIYKLVRENPELNQKEITTICNLDIYKGTMRKRIQEAKGIYKIDLFPKENKKEPRKRKSYPKKKKIALEAKAVEVVDQSNLPLFTDPLALGPLGENIETESEDVNVDVTTSELLLETLMSPGPEIHEMHVVTDIKTLAYEDNPVFSDDQHFEDPYVTMNDSVNVHESDDDMFAIPDADSVKQDFIIASHYDTFSSQEEEDEGQEQEPEEEEEESYKQNVKVELLEVSPDLEASPENIDETHEANQSFEVIVAEAEEPAPVPTPRKRRGRKPKHQTLCDLDVDNISNEQEEQGEQEENRDLETKPKAKSRKPRTKREPNYLEALEGEGGRGRKEKRAKKRKIVNRRVETKKEKRERIVREKIEWEKNRKDTTDIEKKKILIMAECGMTTEDIAKALKKSRRTVQRWISKHNKGLDMDKKERGRRPRKTTADQDAWIIQLVKEHPNMSRKEILKMAQVNLHKVTLKNRLNEAGMFFNSQGVKILDFTEQPTLADDAGKGRGRKPKQEDAHNEHEPDVYDDHEHENALLKEEELDHEEATTIITCSSLTPTPAITNAILTCPTRSTTLIITNSQSIELEPIHVTQQIQGVVSVTSDSFHNYTLY